MAGAWATPQEVIDVTGVNVTAPQLAQAQATIEDHCNRIYADSDRIRARDLYWLGRAVARQAAWEVGQYDLNTRLDTSNVQQDGVVATLNSVTLGPRAKQALQRVSWMRSRTIHIRSAFESGAGRSRNPLADSSDDDYTWQPMDGGAP